MNEDKPTPDPQEPKQSSFWAELKRRKVIRVGIAYAAVAWVIVEVASATFEGFGIPDWAFRFVTLMVLLGFPIAIILAWAFDVTPEGIKVTKSVDSTPVSKKQQRKQNWMAYAMGAAVPTVIFGILALYFFFQAKPAEETFSSSNSQLPSSIEDKSIAVLPLVNMSPDPDNAFFADGVQEEILTNLAKVHDLLVIGRTSTLRYRDTTKKPG